jgi:hypothetical protein
VKSKKTIGFIIGLSMVVITGISTAGNKLGSSSSLSCVQECRQDLADCRELGGSGCAAKFAACKAAC